MNYKRLLESLWTVRRVTDSPEQSKSKIHPLADRHAVRELDSHAIVHRNTAGSSVLGTEYRILDITPSVSATRRVRTRDGLRQKFVDSVVEDTTARDASRGRAVTSDAMSQSRVRSSRSGEDGRDGQHHLSGKGTIEDERRAHISTLEEESRNLHGQKQLWTKIASTRLTLREQRTTWRSKREEMYEIDAQLIQKLDKIEFLSVDDVKEFVLEIKTLYQILQEARFVVASEELEYERIEDKLVQQEKELRDLRSPTRGSSAAESVDIPDHNDELPPHERDPTESVVSSHNIRRNQSAEARRYLLQKGDVDLLRDQLMDLEIYHSQVTEEQADRRDANLEPDEALTAFLDNFEKDHHALASRLRDAERILADYKEALQEPDDSAISERRFDLGNQSFEARDSAQSLFGEEEGSEDQYLSKMEDRKVAATAKAFLSSQADHVAVYELLNTGPGSSPVDKSIYINLWMLHHLRKSPNGIARLVSQHEQNGLFLDPDDFKQQVLAHWLEDGTTHASDRPRFAADSHDLSMVTASGEAQNSRAASDNAQQADRHNAFLLRIGLSARHTQTEL